MTVFAIACTAMLVIAVLLVLRPMLRQAGDPQAARLRGALEAARSAGVIDAGEYERKLAALASNAKPAVARVPLPIALGIGGLLAGGVIAVYLVVGEPRALDPQAHVRTTGHDGDTPSIEQAIAGLEQRLLAEPEDRDGWTLLGRAYKAIERFDDARKALDRARTMAPEDPTLMVEYAEALALAAPERRFPPEARTLLEQALAIEPAHERGLWLFGISEVQAGNYDAAIGAWEKLLPLLEPGSEVATSVAAQIAEARQRSGVPPGDGVAAATPAAGAEPPTAAAAPPTAVAGDGPRLTVRVDISPELKQRLAASDVLYVFARLPQGPRMPLAIQRIPAPQFPLTVELDDSMGMLPSLKLSSAGQVIVGARVSKTGNAQPQSGDYEVLSAPLAVSEQAVPLELLIETVLP